MIRTGDVARLAEQATLGSLLLDPTHLGEVDRWLRGQDFTEAWHRDVWTLMREAHHAGHPLDAFTLGEALRERLPAHRVHLVGVHDLLRAVPVTDVDPRVYARMVVDRGIRREVAAQGVLIEASALAAAVNLEAKAITSGTRVVGAAMIVAGERWADAHNLPTSSVVDSLPVQVRAAGQDPHLRLAADRFLSLHPGLDPVEAQVNEARLVACLVSHPTAIAPTIAWLPPGRLTNPPWRTVYTALGQLADAGRDVDLVTLSAQTLLTARTDGPAPELEALVEAIDAETVSVPGHLRGVVAADQLRRLAATGTEHLRAIAADPAVAVPEILGHVHTVLDGMRHLATVLPEDAAQPHRATGHLRLVHRRDLLPPDPELREGPAAG